MNKFTETSTNKIYKIYTYCYPLIATLVKGTRAAPFLFLFWSKPHAGQWRIYRKTFEQALYKNQHFFNIMGFLGNLTQNEVNLPRWLTPPLREILETPQEVFKGTKALVL